jgi:predicted alpha/beta-fold hydrolase
MSEQLLNPAEAAASIAAPDFVPPRWLSNPHLQSIVPSLSIRRPLVLRRARALLAASATHILDCGNGVRLLGHYSSQTAAGRPPARDVVVLLHGWEGSADSMYVLSLGAHLFELGCDVFRLNFRDHGPSHHLNREIFHSCRLDEVIGAVRAVQSMTQDRRVSIAGFSLGGNFALRVAARAASSNLNLQRAVAVCPVLRPHSTMHVLDNGSFVYKHYFLDKWKRSLRIKQSLFPDVYDFREVFAQRSLRRMTEMLIDQFREFANIDEYLNGYAIVGDALSRLEVPSHALIALDDPIIPAHDVAALARNPHLDVIAIPRGGHCGFMDGFNRASWADRRIAKLLGVEPKP